MTGLVKVSSAEVAEVPTLYHILFELPQSSATSLSCATCPIWISVLLDCYITQPLCGLCLEILPAAHCAYASFPVVEVYILMRLINCRRLMADGF